jgi:small subunit ribosomal protein S2
MQRVQFQLLSLKKKLQRIVKEKTQGKTVQEIDREKLEEKFSKDKKETLN